MRYTRDMRGYGANPPDPKWPGGAHVAVQFVVNYEEGGENCVLHGDKASEAFLSEIVGAAPWVGQRHWNMESIYEYGARAGFWRLLRLFTESHGADHLAMASPPHWLVRPIRSRPCRKPAGKSLRTG
jgi:peptidoglycan/xylan/chitin deacetylase (PgdA/CDA1 family)